MKGLPGGQHRSPRHPIAVAAERTGLSQDVLRVWERRYGAVRPRRGAGGHRLYSDADIERLTLLSSVIRAGRSVGQVAALSTDALAALVDEDTRARTERLAAADVSTAESDVVGAAIGLTRALDGAGLNEVLRRAAAAMGMPAFLESVAAPLLRRVGDEWHAGRLTPSQEHLASAVLYDLIMETVRSLVQKSDAPRLLVATLAGDRHVMGAALVGASAALDGWQLVFLGADLPAAEIADAARAAEVGIVAISVVYFENREHVLAELRALRSGLPREIRLVVGGSSANALVPELSALGVGLAADLAGLLAELHRDRAEG